MAKLIIETFIAAPAEICFDMVRCTDDGAAASEPLALGQQAMFDGRLFGFRTRVVVRVVELDRPRKLVDEMIEGGFKAFRHVHEFVAQGGGTLLRDTLIWRSPFGISGKLADGLFIERHLKKLVTTRNTTLKRCAEAK